MVHREIERLQKIIRERQLALIQQLDNIHLFQFLFDLAITFEAYAFPNQTNTIENATQWLGKLIQDVIKSKSSIKLEQGDVEKIQVGLLSNLLIKKDKRSVNPDLEKLFKLYLAYEKLEELRQIDKYDRSCNVIYKGNNEFRTQLAHLEGRQYDIKVGLKYQHQTAFYYNKASIIVEELIKAGQLKLLGKNELDIEASRVQCIQKIAARELLFHYGIEDEFKFEGIHYKTKLLLEILSFLITYPQVRYDIGFEKNAKYHNIPRAVLQTVTGFIQKGGREIPGPLFFCTRTEMEERMASVFAGHFSKEDISFHLDFFSIELDSNTEELELYKTPLLRFDNLVAFFVRPLMLQNPWIPLLYNLIGRKGNADERKRVERSTLNLAEFFKKRGFHTVADYKIDHSKEKGTTKTDLDVGALKDGYLFLIQAKMTSLKSSYQQVNSHIEDTLKKEAVRQIRETIEYLEENWLKERQMFPTSLNWDQLTVVPLIISTIFERDRQKFSGFLKISQFELERYLENDAYFLFNNDQESSGENHRFYENEPSGSELYGLIKDEKLWEFLDPIILEKNVADYLPTFSYSA